MKMKAKFLIATLATLAIVGCSTTEYIYIHPECSPAVKPVIPVITNDELSSVSDETYIKLQHLKIRLANWGLENQAIIKEVCKGMGE